jgi:hypothetical protein
MPIGQSGRVVIEIDPELKQNIYQSLKEDGSNMKDWFLKRVDEYMAEKSLQQELFTEEEQSGRRVSR